MQENILSSNLERIRTATDSIRTTTGTTGEVIENVVQAVADLKDECAVQEAEIAELEAEIERITPKGTISITQNGTISVAPYASANVAVPGPTGTINITSNGITDVTNYASANVAIPGPSGTLNITSNDTYDVTNYSTAIVAVPQPSGNITITTNGNYTVRDYSTAAVQVDTGAYRVRNSTQMNAIQGMHRKDICIITDASTPELPGDAPTTLTFTRFNGNVSGILSGEYNDDFLFMFVPDKIDMSGGTSKFALTASTYTNKNNAPENDTYTLGRLAGEGPSSSATGNYAMLGAFVIRDMNGTPIMETLNNSHGTTSMYKYYLTVENNRFNVRDWIPGMTTPDLTKAAHIDDIVAAGDNSYYLSMSYTGDTNSKYAACSTSFEWGTYKWEQTFTRNPVTKYTIYWCSIAAADPTYDTYIYDGSRWQTLGPIDTTGGNE